MRRTRTRREGRGGRGGGGGGGRGRERGEEEGFKDEDDKEEDEEEEEEDEVRRGGNGRVCAHRLKRKGRSEHRCGPRAGARRACSTGGWNCPHAASLRVHGGMR